MGHTDADGSILLTSDQVAELLAAAAEHAGGSLVGWRLDHVDANPRRSTTATYLATVDWPSGRREELFGASVRAGGRSGNDDRAVVFGDGDREVAVWMYPHDPDLPGLRRAAVPVELGRVLQEYGVLAGSVAPDTVRVETVLYRPRRRAVIRAVVPGSAGPEVYFVKVLPEPAFGPILERHLLLREAGLPTPAVTAATPDHLLVLREVSGRPLAHALFDEAMPCRAENLVALLDTMPPAVAGLPRRAPWSEAIATYAEMIGRALPTVDRQLRWLVEEVSRGLGTLPPGAEATHGDFHEGQLFVAGGVVTGLIDVDTVGPGRRADDLACLIAHLATVQRMNAEQAAGLSRLISLWLQVFDTRVDPVELRLRAAGVIVSLATGPYRGQEPDWQGETAAMVEAAVGLVRSAYA